MALKRGDIILVPFPFTDLTATKVRPALVVSADPQKEDVIIAFISSVVSTPLRDFDLYVSLKDPDCATTGLKVDSVVKLGKLLTLSSLLILRRLGRLSPRIQSQTDELLKKALGLQ